MAEPTFNGVPIFANGTSVIVAEDWPCVMKHTSFPGLSGSYELRLGKRARPIHQTVTMYAATAVSLVTAIETIRDYRGGPQYTLVDGFGKVYQNVSMQSVRPLSQIETDGSVYWQTLAVEYLQLAPNP